jgi:cytochrome P450
MTHRPGLLDITLITSFTEADEILKSRNFMQDQQLEPSKAPNLQGNLNSLHGAAHFQRRRVESALFRRGSLLHYEEQILVPELRATLRRLAEHRRPDGKVRADDLPLLVRSALVRASSALIGFDLDDDAAVERLLAYSTAIAEGRDVVWATTNQDEVVRRVHETWRQLLAEYYHPARARREKLIAEHAAGTLPESQLPNDLITVLLQNPDALAGDGTADLIANEVGLFLTASVNTTTVATPKTVGALLAWIQTHPEDRPLLADERFLRQAAQEALRLDPTVPFLLREAVADTVLAGGRAVAKSSLVRIDIRAANRDQTVFGSDADEFDPHRQSRIPRRYGISFGGGIHMCIGLEFTTGNQSGPEEERTVGMVIHILRELFEAKIELDPDDLPRMKSNTTQHTYVSFPVLFSGL